MTWPGSGWQGAALVLLKVTRDGLVRRSLAVRASLSDLTRRPSALALAAWQCQRATGKFKLPTESGAAASGPSRTLELPLPVSASADWINLNLKIASVVLHRRWSGVCNGRFHRLECAPRLRPNAIGISYCHRDSAGSSRRHARIEPEHFQMREDFEGMPTTGDWTGHYLFVGGSPLGQRLRSPALRGRRLAATMQEKVRFKAAPCMMLGHWTSTMPSRLS